LTPLSDTSSPHYTTLPLCDESGLHRLFLLGDDSKIGLSRTYETPTRLNQQQISNLLSGRKTPSPTRNGYSFLLTLLGLEGLIVKYWVNGRIYTVSTVTLSHPISGGSLIPFRCVQLDDEQFLPPFLGLALVSAYIGKNALRDVQVDRLASRLRA
jgi:hypothetical protein